MNVRAESRRSRVESRKSAGEILRSTLVSRLSSAFTLIEMLVVLAIMGIIAAMVVPAIKNFGHSDAMTAADQQMLGDVARARQLAMSQRTTVYMVFVPTNFWVNFNLGTLTAAQLTALTNLCGEQLTGYTFMSYGNVGDQPGQHRWHYLAPWQTLPDGVFIPLQMFIPGPPITVVGHNLVSGAVYATYPIAPFSTMNNVAFPTEDTDPGMAGLPSLPYIAFNYLGQLTTNGVTMAAAHGYIPLAKGAVMAALDPTSKAYQFGSPQVHMQDSTNMLNWTNAYNIIDIDPLTGKALLQTPKIQ